MPAATPVAESTPKAVAREISTQAAGRPASPSAQPTGGEGSENTSMQDTKATSGEPLASGMQLDSHMHDVFRATRSPGNLRAIGGVEVSWSLSVHGTHGEIIGSRMITHIADCTYAGRDRIERADGCIYARVGQQVVAHKNGIPYEVLNAQAKAELELFGTHLRMPWCFGESQSYVIMARMAVKRRGETLWQLELHGRPQRTDNVFGPEAGDVPRDRFFLLYEPTTGQPRELVHRFASSGQQRRVLLEDWQDVHGVRMPKRRIYVDQAGRPTTTVEMISISPRRTSDRDFRVL